MSSHAWHSVAAWGGPALEALGLWLVYLQARKLRREELREISRFGRFWAEVKLTIENPAPPRPAYLGGIAASVSNLEAQLTTGAVAPIDPLDALRDRLNSLEQTVSSQATKLEAENQRTSRRVQSATSKLERRLSEIEQKRRTDIDHATKYETIGVAIFGLGVVCNLLANV